MLKGLQGEVSVHKDSFLAVKCYTRFEILQCSVAFILELDQGDNMIAKKIIYSKIHWDIM